MPETYSLATTGIPSAGSPFAVANATLPDSSGRPGSEQLAMSTGSQIYCKKPDGSFGWFTIDAERSRPGGPIYLLAV